MDHVYQRRFSEIAAHGAESRHRDDRVSQLTDVIDQNFHNLNPISAGRQLTLPASASGAAVAVISA